MKLLKTGSFGPSVQLLQLALNRAGAKLEKDGIFGLLTKAALIQFQKTNGLAPDGIAGAQTNAALLPYYTGYRVHTVRAGDSIFALARRYGSSESAIMTANPDVVPGNLRIGSMLVIPLGFDIVPTDIACSSALVGCCVRGLSARYPFISGGEIGKSVLRRPLWSLMLGRGENRVMYNAAHHANEWICTLLLLKFTEELAAAYASGGKIFSQSAAEILDYSTLLLIPSVNPDGTDLAAGDLTGGESYARAARIAQEYPQYRFPLDWKANILGTDLNLQYPAGWEQARENKAKLGIVSPAPADYVGPSPLSAPESRAVYDCTLRFAPALTLAYHTQGEVIYWRYKDYAPPQSANIVRAFSEVSDYSPENTPFDSGFAGYKDWFIDSLDRPGFTVEAGKGKNPLPIEDFDEIYRRNLGILTLGALMT